MKGARHMRPLRERPPLAFLAILAVLAFSTLPDPVHAQEPVTLGYEYLWDPDQPEEWQTLGRSPQGLIRGEPGELFIADTRNDRVLLVDLKGSLTQEIGRHGSGPGEFRQPGAICYDRQTKSMWVADWELQRCSQFTRDAGQYTFRTSFRVRPAFEGRAPTMAVADSVHLWLMNTVRGEEDTCRIRLLSTDGETTRLFAPAEASPHPWRPSNWNRGNLLALSGERLAYIWLSLPRIEIWDRKGKLIQQRLLEGPSFKVRFPRRLEDDRYAWPISFAAVGYDDSHDLLFVTAREPGLEGTLIVGIDTATLQESERYFLPDAKEEERSLWLVHLVVVRTEDSIEFMGLDNHTLCLVRVFPTGS